MGASKKQGRGKREAGRGKRERGTVEGQRFASSSLFPLPLPAFYLGFPISTTTLSIAATTAREGWAWWFNCTAKVIARLSGRSM